MESKWKICARYAGIISGTIAFWLVVAKSLMWMVETWGLA